MKVSSFVVFSVAFVAVLVGLAMASVDAEPSSAMSPAMINGFSLAEMITHDRVTGAIASMNVVGHSSPSTCDDYSDCSGTCLDNNDGNDSRSCVNFKLYVQTTEGLLILIAFGIIFCMCPCCWPCCVVFAIPLALATFALLIAQITAFRYEYKI